MRQLEGDPWKWFIIDWNDATGESTLAADPYQFNRETHAPSVFKDGHGAEVDVWGVGHLILSCEAVNISEELRKLGERMMMQGDSLESGDLEKMNTQIALNEIKGYQIKRSSAVWYSYSYSLCL